MRRDLFLRSFASLVFLSTSFYSLPFATALGPGAKSCKNRHTRTIRRTEASAPSATPNLNPQPERNPPGLILPQGSAANFSEASSNSTGNGTNTNFKGQFWAGATIGTVARMEDIPGRVFYDYDGKTVKDPIKTLRDSGVNAVRIEASRDQCLGPSNWTNDANTLGDELLFTLDFGCIDTQVKLAQRGVAQGMRVVLTINQGFNIPPSLESATYSEMVADVQRETKRQLQPFLTAGVLPDVILLENEGSDGFLFNETKTGHTRGNADSKVSTEQLDRERCGLSPTGSMDSYPQLAGYYKAEILAANAAISAAGYSTDTVRYGLHSHAQYVDWKEGIVHGHEGPNETTLLDSKGQPCTGTSPIPESLLSLNISTMLNIAGFSAYPDPMTPTDINSTDSQMAILSRPLTSMQKLQSYAERYGRYTSGPFIGQYKLHALGVEWATSYTSDQIPQEQQLTGLMWQQMGKFESLLGILWYEPWYCRSDWEGGHGTLCRVVDPIQGGAIGEVPTENLKTWGAAAKSPWVGSGTASE
ncbi:hypothetical protein ACLMJK_002873 [Lecanora helva]